MQQLVVSFSYQCVTAKIVVLVTVSYGTTKTTLLHTWSENTAYQKQLESSKQVSVSQWRTLCVQMEFTHSAQ